MLNLGEMIYKYVLTAHTSVLTFYRWLLFISVFLRPKAAKHYLHVWLCDRFNGGCWHWIGQLTMVFKCVMRDTSLKKFNFFSRKVAYITYDVPSPHDWQDPTSHNAQVLWIVEIYVYVTSFNAPNVFKCWTFSTIF
jgi:hypothetical protein